MIQPQYAQPYAQGTPSANAVNIQIFEPKAYASPQPVQPNYTNQLYNYPQASLYNPQAQYMPYPMPMPQMMPQMMPYPQMMPQMMPPQMGPMPYPQDMVMQPQGFNVPPQITMPEQQQMPAPAITQQAVQPQPEQIQPTPEVQVQQQPQADAVNIQGLVSGLQSQDPSVQEATITQIADLSQAEPAKAQQVLNEQIMTGLAGIISQDISNLPGPTPEQTAILQRAANGEQLNPQEIELAQQLSPQATAAKNKIISMFTLAMLQKNQRDELDAYMASQGNANLPQLQMQDLIGFNEIQNSVMNDPNPEIRLAGIQAISYVAKPEDAQTVQMVLQNSLNDPEPLIQQAAGETLAKIGAAPQMQQAA